MPTTKLQPWFPLVGICMGLLCAVLNFRFAYRIGAAVSATDGYLLAGVVTVAEVALWVLPLVGAKHFSQRKYVRCGLAWSIWALCAAVSFFGSLGYIATSREATVRVAMQDTRSFDDAKGTVDELAREIAALTARAVSRIEADIESVPLDGSLGRPGRRLKLIQLRAELADAKRAIVLKTKIEALKPATLAGKPASGDPAASLLSERMGIPLNDAQFAIAFALSVVGLVLSSLGPFALTVEDGAPIPTVKVVKAEAPQIRPVALAPVREQPIPLLTKEVSARPRLTKTIRW